MTDYTRITDEHLLKVLHAWQGVQKLHHPDSTPWKVASKYIHEICAENARRYPPK